MQLKDTKDLANLVLVNSTDEELRQIYIKLNKATEMLKTSGVNKKINRDLVIDSMVHKQILIKVLLNRNLTQLEIPKMQQEKPEFW